MTDEQRSAIRRLELDLNRHLEVHQSEGGNLRVVCLSKDREFFVRPNGAVERVRRSRHDRPFSGFNDQPLSEASTEPSSPAAD